MPGLVLSIRVIGLTDSGRRKSQPAASSREALQFGGSHKDFHFTRVIVQRSVLLWNSIPDCLSSNPRLSSKSSTRLLVTPKQARLIRAGFTSPSGAKGNFMPL